MISRNIDFLQRRLAWYLLLDNQILPPLKASKDLERTHVRLVMANDDNISYFNYKSFSDVELSSTFHHHKRGK